MNVKFSYLYRDAGNYKNHNVLIFSNPNSLKTSLVADEIRKCLIDELWFYADKWSLPDLHFTEYRYDPNIDHEWHEFESLEETFELVTEKISIDEFLRVIKDATIMISSKQMESWQSINIVLRNT